MVRYYTKQEARDEAARAKLKATRQYKAATRILKEEAAYANDYERFDIFVSHSVADAELILGVKAILENQGFKVYVDWVEDAQLDRSKVNKETADLIRKRMKQSNSMVWVATEAASNSKWMPWELGYFDGSKPNQVAILPLVDKPGDTFQGQEYLSLYPVVRHNTYTDGRSDVFVEQAAHGWTTLKKFGTGQGGLSPY